MRVALGLLFLTLFMPLAGSVPAAAEKACKGCGCKGGPGFRSAATGKCVPWKALDKVCGTPPDALVCTFEGGGIGATGIERGTAFIHGLIATFGIADIVPVGGFAARATLTEGYGCDTPQRMRTVACVDAAPDECERVRNEHLAAGQCVVLSAGQFAEIEAGSRSFEALRVRVPEHPVPLWVNRRLVLEMD